MQRLWLKCPKRVCDIVREHYMRPEARAAFVRALQDTYGYTRRQAKSVASKLAREDVKETRKTSV